MSNSVDLSQLKINRQGNQASHSWFKPWMIIVLCLTLVAAYLLTGGFGQAGTQVKTTKVMRVNSSEASSVLTASGYIVARSKAEISPKAVGRISWIKLEEGQRVQKGELIAKLESAELFAQKKQIEVSIQQSKRDLERYKSLLEQKAISQQLVETTDTQYQTQVAQLNVLKEQIKNTEIYSPISGTVTVKKAYLGETVSPQGFGSSASGATFAVIVDMTSLEMEADVSEQNLAKLKTDQPAQVMLDSYPNKAYKARLRQIVPTADRQKGSVKVKIELLEKDANILPEMSARTTFLDKDVSLNQESKEQILVNITALTTLKGEAGVFVIKDNQAVFTPIVIAEKTSTHVIVSSGLNGSENIVADTSIKSSWKDSQAIKIIK